MSLKLHVTSLQFPLINCSLGAYAWWNLWGYLLQLQKAPPEPQWHTDVWKLEFLSRQFYYKLEEDRTTHCMYIGNCPLKNNISKNHFSKCPENSVCLLLSGKALRHAIDVACTEQTAQNYNTNNSNDIIVQHSLCIARRSNRLSGQQNVGPLNRKQL